MDTGISRAYVTGPGKIYFLGNKYQVDGEFSAADHHAADAIATEKGDDPNLADAANANIFTRTPSATRLTTCRAETRRK